MAHKNYFEITADDYASLGREKGKLFGEVLSRRIQSTANSGEWSRMIKQSLPYLEATKAQFPQFVEELTGYAKAARVPFDDLWLLAMEDELTHGNRCTTVVTNRGFMIAHNEDWDRGAKGDVCILRKTVAGVTTFELYYMSTLGGNSISINSHGFVQAVNTLTHIDGRIGVPRNVIARWLSETQSPDDDYTKLKKIRRASGYHHTIVDSGGKIWSIECSAERQSKSNPEPPFAHTNHFLADLGYLEDDDGREGTRERYRHVTKGMDEQMTVAELKSMMCDSSEGNNKSVFNKRTIAQVILDIDHMTAHVWLLRERDKGWQEYRL